ncbi:MAG: BamA/TamA family outer membrane protein [candidate division Zixibacteria bacterium]|nr:BamA/TamA family outer membrane protein [candidate division Zixibacteria bacterium]
MIKVLVTIFTSIMLFVPVRAVEIIFDGTSPSNSREIKRLAEKSIPDSTLADSVSYLLTNEGYLDAEVIADDDILSVSSGTRYKLGKMQFTGDSTFELSSDEIFKRSNLEVAVNSVLERLYEVGYPYASIELKTIRRVGDRVMPELRLCRGPLVRVSGVEYSGLCRSRTELIDRYLSIKRGEPIMGTVLRNAEKAAADISFVTFCPPVRIVPCEGYTTADLLFDFQEKKQFRLEGGGGYIPTDNAGLVWSLNLALVNLYGSGREATIKSERREKGHNLLDIGYRQPLFLIGVDVLRLGIVTRDYRDLFYEFSLTGEYSTRLTPDFSAGVETGWKSVTSSGDLPDYDRFSVGFNIISDHLDNRINPVNGLSMSWSIDYVYRRYSEDSLITIPEKQVFNDTRITVVSDWYRRMIGRLVAHIGLNYTGMETNESLPPLSELVLVGGPGTIRGFHNEQFAAVRTAYGTIEPRYRFESGYLFLFYDGAYLNNRFAENGNTKTEELYRCGYGVGAAFMENNRSVRISFGWNRELDFDQPHLSIEFSTDM